MSDILKNNTFKNTLNEKMTPFKRIFYSEGNMDLIQSMIKLEVNKKGYKIGDQNDIHLLNVMEHFEISRSTNPPLEKDFLNEIKRLNSFIVDYSVSNIMVYIEKYIYYIDNKDKINVMEKTSYDSIKGTNPTRNPYF